MSSRPSSTRMTLWWNTPLLASARDATWSSSRHSWRNCTSISRKTRSPGNSRGNASSVQPSSWALLTWPLMSRSLHRGTTLRSQSATATRGTLEADRLVGVPSHGLLEPFGCGRHLPSVHANSAQQLEAAPTSKSLSSRSRNSVEEVADPLGRPRLDAHRLAGERPPLNPNNEPAHHPAETHLRQPVDADTEIPRVLGRRFLQMASERHEGEASCRPDLMEGYPRDNLKTCQA